MQLPLPASFPEQRKQLPHRAYLRRDRTCTCAYVQECGHSPQKAFLGRAVMGIILSSVAIGLTMFFFYSLISFYDALNDPVMGPQINELINRL